MNENKQLSFVDSILRYVDDCLIPHPERLARDAARLYDLCPGLDFPSACDLAARLQIRLQIVGRQ